MPAFDLPNHLRYDLAHTWVEADADSATVGVTAFTRTCWGAAEFVRLPAAGDAVSAGEAVAQAHCAEAGPCDIFSPLGGTVLAVNEALFEDASLLDRAPYGEGWLFKLRLSNPAELHDLLSADAYRAAILAPTPCVAPSDLGPVFEHSEDAMFVIDANRRIVAQNAAAERLTGFRAEELAQGCRCGHLLHCEAEGEGLHGVACAGIQLLHGLRAAGPTVFSIRRKDSQRVPVSATYSPLPLSLGQPLTLITLRIIP